MSPDLEPVTPRRRALGLELVLVVLVSLAVLVPGIWRYALVDPWETHYGEVTRMMLQEHDYVHMQWPGGMDPQDNEGFRSKPVLMFWLEAAAMKTVGLGAEGGYSGEMAHDARTMVAIRLPFVLMAILGLTLVWWMLARLVNRRTAWLALLVTGTCPFFALVSRQGIPDMLLVSCVMGALAMFTMAMEDGDRPIDDAFSLRLGRTRVVVDQRLLMLLVCGGMVGIQLLYYVVYFMASPWLAIRGFPHPLVFFPLFMGLMFGALSRDGWLIFRLPFVLVGGVIASIRGVPMPVGPANRSIWRKVFDDYLAPWDKQALDRWIVRGIVFPFAWAAGQGWAATDGIADRILGMSPMTTMRQVYLMWCYAFLGVSVLAKGPPGLGVVGFVGVAYVIAFGDWRGLYEGKFEIKRGLLLLIVVALPWHIAEWLKEGVRFIDEYLFTHILNRATVGVDNSPGTFEMYSSQLGHGMWLWAALLPAALAATVLRARIDTREGRVRFIMGLWAICGMAFFSLVQTKFHHYILPIVPALGVLVAFFLDDVAAKRDRLHPIYAALAIGVVALVARDLAWEPKRWIEMFTYRYDRPWPSNEPWQVDTSDGFLGLGVIAAIAIVIAALPWRRVGVAALCAAGLAICVWCLQVYMPVAGTHWGMREAMRSYYEQRTVYGEKLVYFGARELYDDWHDAGDTWTFETFVPDNLQVGQPMTLTIELHKPEDEKITQQTIALVGTATDVGDHSVTVTLPRAERAKLDPLIARGKGESVRGRPAVRAVDADRMMAWQLYWRGENFWSGDEIFGYLPEMKTGFQRPDNVALQKYLNDRTKAPLGRRYFAITEAGRATSLRALLPTQRARDSFEVINTTSNKFSMVAFYL